MDIRCDLREDVERICRTHLSNSGYKINERSKLRVVQQYLNVLRREVQVWPREVKLHPDLFCPEELKPGFSSLVNSLELGLNVNIYLSSNLTTADFQDGFLNDYGLHHFHLGSKLEESGKSRGFVKRTGPVVLAYITNEVAYLIDIKGHGRTGDPYIWTDQDVIEKLHYEWPESIELFKFKGILASGVNPTPLEKKKLRNAGINTPIKMPDGTVYMAPGGGVTTANTSTRLQTDSDRFHMESSNVLNFLCSKIREGSLQLKYPVNLKLKAFRPCYFFYCEMNKVGYRIDLDGEHVITRVFVWGSFPDYYPCQFEFNLISKSIF